MKFIYLISTAFLFISVQLYGENKPNILFCISDDQSFDHTGANGDPVIKTPAFDRVASEGIRFTNAFCDAPSCGPSRSAILTGQHIWRLEEAGNIHSTLPAKFLTYTDLLKKAGYFVGCTGKAWSPGRLEPGGRSEQPAGKVYKSKLLNKKQMNGLRISRIDYAQNFEVFLNERPKDKPFCFWLGTSEPHRHYAPGSGKKSGKNPAEVVVPHAFPDNKTVRNDILDYMLEVEHFDSHVNQALKALDKAGELDNTIIVITSDHGMPFPRAKATLYDLGTKVPLAIRWPKGIKSSGRIFKGMVNLSDLAPTFLEAAGVEIPDMMTGKSLMPALKNEGTAHRTAAFTAMERHDGCRKGGKGYPCRAIRTKEYLYIFNFKPERWPAGDPDKNACARAIPYGELDSCPTKDFMMENINHKLSILAFSKKPQEELYVINSDPGQLKNVAGEAQYSEIKNILKKQLFDHLKKTEDPRVNGGKVLWDYYPYYGIRKNKDWAVDPIPAERK